MSLAYDMYTRQTHQGGKGSGEGVTGLTDLGSTGQGCVSGIYAQV